MSEEDFLTRWSRRKRDVAAAEKATPPVADVKPVEENADEPPEVDAEARAKVEATLPSLESITELSDVTAFLKAGVPADLTRAALRRVWTVDPSIRDFIGLAENSWDFTDPAAMPGFGPLEDTEQVRRMIAQVIDEIGKTAKSAPSETTVGLPEGVENSNHSNEIITTSTDRTPPPEQVEAENGKQNSAQALGEQVLLQSNTENIAAQHGVGEAQEKPKQFTYRTHGRALPM